MVAIEEHLMMQLILIALELNVLQKELKNPQNKNIITNIYRIQAYNSIMCGYFCIRFIDFVLYKS